MHSTIFILYLHIKQVNMNIENTVSQMKKGLLEMCIMGAIKKDGEAYPSDILEQLKGAQLVVLEGTLYPLLTRLKNAGLLNYRWEESTSGPPRKYFSLTKEGEELYLQLKNSWTDLSNSVNHLTNTIEK